jgi:SAM-dependent methyltransferase
MNELIYKDTTTPKEVKKLREERPSNGPTPATTAAAQRTRAKLGTQGAHPPVGLHRAALCDGRTGSTCGNPCSGPRLRRGLRRPTGGGSWGRFGDGYRCLAGDSRQRPGNHSAACAFRFEAGDAASPRTGARDQFDRIMAVFLFNYLTRAQTLAVLKAARNRLAPKGVFVFTVPHPCFPYMRTPAAPFFFETEGHNYFDGVDTTYEGHIWRRDGVEVPVRCVHKTFADYFSLLREAGWRTLPKLVELRVQPEHVTQDPAFFGPLAGLPLHVLFRMEAA